MNIKVKRVSAELAAEILRKMVNTGWANAEMARFLTLYSQTTRSTSLLGWLAQPEDELDQRLYQMLLPFLTDD
jgi:hypothetical protein